MTKAIIFQQEMVSSILKIKYNYSTFSFLTGYANWYLCSEENFNNRLHVVSGNYSHCPKRKKQQKYDQLNNYQLFAISTMPIGTLLWYSADRTQF